MQIMTHKTIDREMRPRPSLREIIDAHMSEWAIAATRADDDDIAAWMRGDHEQTIAVALTAYRRAHDATAVARDMGDFADDGDDA